MEENKESKLAAVGALASIFIFFGFLYLFHSTVESFSNWIGISFWWIYSILATLLFFIARIKVDGPQALVFMHTILVLAFGSIMLYWVIYWFIQFGGWFYYFIMRI